MVPKVAVLIWADVLAGYAMWVMMTYLTNVWKLDITHAAAVVNVFTGLAIIMPIGMAFLVDTFLGHYRMLLLSSLAYCFGMSLLAMSTPPILSRYAGNCDAYKPDCIGDTQKALFYTALALIAVGISGHITSLMSFWKQEQDKTPTGQHYSGRKLLGFFAVILVPLFGGIALQYIKPWSVRFGIPAICTVIATILFISGSRSYKSRHDIPEGSPLTIVFRVFIASASKMFYSRDANDQLNGNPLSLTPTLRCLDKAAIIVPTQTRHRWKLCTVTEVEKTKIFIRMIPMWMTFIMCGIVSSIGATYFLEQANNMNRKVGRLNVPRPILLILYDISKSMFARFCLKVPKKLSKRYTGPLGMVVAMLFSVLCCIMAAKVETMRLDAIKRHEILDKPNEKIPMSMFWLLPQFLLLGALDGCSGYLLGDRDKISGDDIACFFIDQVPDASMSICLLFFTRGVFGAGLVGSVLSVYVVGKVSEKGGKLNWFQETLNKSRLDNYYWTLAVLSSINLFLSIFVAIWYNYQHPSTQEISIPGYQESDTPYDDDVQCCCCCG